jgi:dihydroorotate dehydrogenase (NAD+) catalytic subunit
MTYRVSRAVEIPVIGMGGIMNATDAVEYLLAGASAIQIGTANFVDPSCAATVLAGIEKYANDEGLTCIEDFGRLLGS